LRLWKHHRIDNQVFVLNTLPTRYHLSIFQQLPHQSLDWLNGNKHFLTLKVIQLCFSEFLVILDYESGREDRKILTFKVNFLCQKSAESFQFIFSLKNIKSGAQLLLTTLFVYHHFWSTLFTKIEPKFQTFTPNWELICQRPFKVRKCLFGLMRKSLKNS
jgi:hypothetical protein